MFLYIAACGWKETEVTRPASVEGQTELLIKVVKKMNACSQLSYPSQPGLNNLKDNAGRSFQGERKL